MNWKRLTLNQLLVYIAIAFFVCYSLGQLQRFQVAPGVAVYLHDVVVVAFLSLFFVYRRKEFLLPLRKAWQWKGSWLLASWVGAGIVIGSIAGFSLVIPLLYLARLCFYAFFTYLITLKLNWNAVRVLKEHVPQPAVKMLVFAGVAIGYLGLLQYVLIPDTRFLTVLGWDDHYYRLVSTLLDPAFTGMILVLTLIAWVTQEITAVKFMKYGVVVGLLLAIALTFSRSSYLALAVGLVSVMGLAIMKKALVPKWPMIILFIFTIFIAVMPKPAGEGGKLLRTSTIEARTTNITFSLESLKPYQWMIGRGMFQPLLESVRSDGLTQIPDHAQVPDNLFVMLISGMGMGGVVILTIIAFIYRREIWSLPNWVLASCLAVLVHSQFNNTLFQPFIWIWITMVIWLGMKQMQSEEPTA